MGGGLGFVPLTPLIMTSVAPSEAGAAGGVLQTVQQLGGTLGLATLVTVFGAALRDSGNPLDPAAVTSAMTAAFTVAAVIATANALVALTFRKSPQPSTVDPHPAPARVG